MSTLNKHQQPFREGVSPADFSEQGDYTIPAVNIKMVRIESGSFQIGTDDGYDDETPVHAVTISQPFWLGKYGVMQREYEELMGENPSHFKGPNLPVERVSWYDARAFCTKLTEQERCAGRLSVGYQYRLPTEAEWEYAARGGVNGRGFTYAGSNNVGDVAWFWENSGGKTHPVGNKMANEPGLHDMSGNVYEWCYDWYDDSFYSQGSGTDPVSTQLASCRVFRGGSWFSSARFCSSTFRGWFIPGDASYFLGFRVAFAPAFQ